MWIVWAYLCVHVDATEGMSGRLDYSFEDKGDMLSLCEDELDIIGKSELDDDENEGHVGNHLPSILMERIRVIL